MVNHHLSPPFGRRCLGTWNPSHLKPSKSKKGDNNSSDFSPRSIYKTSKRVHPGILTWNIIIEVRKIIFPSKWVICRFLPLNLPGCSRIVFCFCCFWDSSHLFERRRWRKFFATKKPRLPESMVHCKGRGCREFLPKKCTKHSGLGCHFKKIPFKSRASCRNFGWKNWRICWVLFLSQKKEKSLVPNTCRIKMTYMGSCWLTKAPSPKKDVFLLLFLWFTSSRWSNAANFPLVHGWGVRTYWKKSLQRVVKFW